MKKQTLKTAVAVALFAAFLTPSKVSAQWNEDKNYVSLITFTEEDGEFYASSPDVARTKDGKFWLTYKMYEKDGVHTYLELFDKDLHRLFEQPIKVNHYMTPTWWSKNGLAVASDGSALVSIADSRTECKGMSYEEITAEDFDAHSFQPTIYKINQDGDFEWGLDGITYETLQYAPYSQIMVIGDDIYWKIIDATEDWEIGGPYLMRLDNDGNYGYDEFKRIGGQFIPSTNGDFLVVNGMSEVMRYDRDCNNVWSEPVTFDRFSCSSMAMDPYQLASDGEGGVAVAFLRNMGKFSHNVRVQYINGDGELGFGIEGLDTYAPQEFEHSYPIISSNNKTKEILVNFISNFDNHNFTFNSSKFSYNGEYLWGDVGKEMASKKSQSGFCYSPKASRPVDQDEWIVFYSDNIGFADESLCITRIDKDGNKIWKKVIGRSIDIWDTNLFCDEEASYIFWRDENKDRGIHALRIFNDGTFETPAGIDENEIYDGDPIAYYSIDGKKLATPQKGINIAKYSDGKTRKIIK